MSLQATVVPDIRMAQYRAGAIEFNAGQHAIFFACPCGCGRIEKMTWPTYIWDTIKGREQVTVKQPIVLRDSVDGVLELHWAGRLVGGKFVEEEMP